MIFEATQPDSQNDQTQDESPQPGRLALLRPLAARDFRLLWAGESVSLLGDQFYFVALSWLTLQLTGSGLALGTVLMAAAIPRAIFMLLGGALTDRFSPRALMLVSNAVRALVAAAVCILIMIGAVGLWQLHIVAIIFGLVDAFFFPAFTTLVPRLLDEDRIAAGNSLVQGSAQLNALIGPAPAGLLIAVAGIAPAFAFDSATFVFSVLMLWLIKGGNLTASVPGAEEGASANPAKLAGLMSSIREGLNYAWRDEVTRAILLMIAAINFSLVGPFLVGIASLADKRFAGGSVAYGTMLSAWGGGALLGTLMAGAIGKPRRRGLLFIGMATLLGIGAALIGFMPNYVWASVVIALMAVGSGFTNVGMVAWLQVRTDPQMLGRVMSVVMLAGVGLSPFSYALAGALVDLDATIMFVSAGALVLLSAVFAAVNRSVRAID